MATIITEKMTFGGNCLTKLNGKNIFVPFALPDETLEIKITEEKRDYAFAEITSIIKSSPYRKAAECPLYQKCGGCNMMHIKEDFQTELRKEILADSFKRAKVQVPCIEVISDSSFGYRSRIQLTNGGFLPFKGNTPIFIENCPVLTKELNDWLKNTPVNKRKSGRISMFGSEKIIPSQNKVIIAKEDFKSGEKTVIGKKVNAKKLQKQKKKYSYTGTSFSEENTVTVNILEKNISFDVRGFFQSNLAVLEKSIKEICGNLSGKKALDLYAGCGTFSVFLSDFFEEVTLVEHNRDALVYAEKNLAGKNHISYGLSGADFVKLSISSDYDAVVVDPPRSGMEKEVCQYLCRSKIPQIRSVSCDPATHARDASFLCKAGYKLEKLFLLDFYPNTSHIESLAIFSYT